MTFKCRFEKGEPRKTVDTINNSKFPIWATYEIIDKRFYEVKVQRIFFKDEDVPEDKWNTVRKLMEPFI